MSENKRYRVFKYPDCDNYGVSDDVAQYTIATFNNHLEAESLCERLNELTDENEELKSRLEDAEREVMHCHMIIDTLVEDAGVNDYNDLINKCDKEILKEMGWK